jgi:ketosteroid isomerase-like protein
LRKLFIAIALVMMLGSLAYGQKMTVEQTFMKMEQEMADALIKGDAAVFEKYIADNGSFTDPGGTFMNKAQTIALIKSGDLKFESSKIDDMKVNVFGKTAIVTYRTTDKGTFKGRDISGQARWTETFIKMKGKWMMVASQGTPIMSPM